MIRTLASMSLVLLTAACSGVGPKRAPVFIQESALDVLVSRYQKGHGGFDRDRRYLDGALLEMGLRESERGDEAAKGMVQKTLLNNIALIDPIDGGANDYSLVVPGRHPWRSPSNTKSLRTQAINLRAYSRAHQLFGGRRYLEAAQSVFGFIDRSLAAQGGGFHEQGGAGLSTTANALTISALVAYHRATGDGSSLDHAIDAADRMMAERMSPSGGFREENDDVSSEATLAMVDALTELAHASSDPRYAAVREQAIKSLDTNEAISSLTTSVGW